MASLLTSCARLMQLRRRHTVIGLIICFAICFFIYSSIPSRRGDLHGMMGQPLNSDAKPFVVQNAALPITLHGASITAGQQHVSPAPLASAPRTVPAVRVTPAAPHSASTPAPSTEALASKRKLGGGGDVFSGSLGQVVLVPYAFNVSKERVSRLQENTMLFRQLQRQVRNTRAYLAAVQPDFDVNAGACRCGKSISMECSCCAKLTMKRFLMERPACVNFTYVLKDHVLRVRLAYERKQVAIAERTLAADAPPMLCAGEDVDLCAAFRNVTYKVQMDSVDHKTSLSGCLDLIMRLKTRPISIYPMGCFHLGRDPKLVHIDKLNNWMP